jgi:hypothetical protein
MKTSGTERHKTDSGDGALRGTTRPELKKDAAYTMNYLRQEKSFRDHGGLTPGQFPILSVAGVTLPA